MVLIYFYPRPQYRYFLLIMRDPRSNKTRAHCKYYGSLRCTQTLCTAVAKNYSTPTEYKLFPFYSVWAHFLKGCFCVICIRIVYKLRCRRLHDQPMLYLKRAVSRPVGRRGHETTKTRETPFIQQPNVFTDIRLPSIARLHYCVRNEL